MINKIIIDWRATYVNIASYLYNIGMTNKIKID